MYYLLYLSYVFVDVLFVDRKWKNKASTNSLQNPIIVECEFSKSLKDHRVQVSYLIKNNWGPESENNFLEASLESNRPDV